MMGNPALGTSARAENSASNNPWTRWAPVTGIVFALLFIASVVVSKVPSNSASNKAWVAAYSGKWNEVGHFATGICLVLAGLCLASFLTILWTRIAATRRPDPVSPLPLVLAGIAGACMAAGGIFMATISATALNFSQPLPGADLLRFANDMGFGMAGVAGMYAAALAVVGLSVQARTAGIFGQKMMISGFVVAAVLIVSFLFFPIAALLIWLIVVSIRLLRTAEARAGTAPAAPHSAAQA